LVPGGYGRHVEGKLKVVKPLSGLWIGRDGRLEMFFPRELLEGLFNHKHVNVQEGFALLAS